jgi:ribosomal protein S18 acetylase RimI-like enzyme
MAVVISEARPGTFTPGELARLGEIVVRAYAAIGALEGDDEYVPELRDVERRSREAVVLVARDRAGGDLLGCVTYVPDGSSPWAEHLEEGEAAIRMLAVAPAAQGRGVGTALVAACLERARAEGRRAVFLHSLPVMTDAQRIYAHFGFRHVPERDWRVDGLLLMGFLLDLR